MSLFLSGLLFVVFALNVAMGSMGSGVFLGDVGEMLVLLAASTCFVVAILKKETAAKNDAANSDQ